MVPRKELHDDDNDPAFDLGNIQQSNATPRSPSRPGPACSVCCLFTKVIIPGVVLVFGTFLVLYLIGGNAALPAPFQGILPDEAHFRESDPFVGEVYTWPARGDNYAGGLQLTVVNALDAIWQPYFATALEQWDSGTPDALTLTTQTGNSCSGQLGVMKVCNGDYGDTGWKGINEVLLQDNEIVSSVARMNDFYFATDGGDDAERQYTMCHEMYVFDGAIFSVCTWE